LLALALPCNANDAKQEKVWSYQEVDTQPVPHELRYPPNDFFPRKDQGKDFIAYIAIVINHKGDVVEAKTIKANDKDFGDEAQARALRWRFAPATLAGKPVGCATVLTIRVHVGTENARGYEIVRSSELAEKKPQQH
jgi:hypothetical protein